MNLDSPLHLAKHFMPHQLDWINAEQAIHTQHKQAVALAEKSVRIGWTYADAFKNVRKRIWFSDRDYLFATKDYPSALEYVRQCYKFAEVFNLTRSVKSHGEETIAVNRLDDKGRPSVFTEDIRIGVIKFDNGSRIIAFSANPQAMSVYGGDVGLDEFAKHPNARLLWETAQARVTWNYDIAVWSSHDGEDTLFNEFAQEARAACSGATFSVARSAGLSPANVVSTAADISGADPSSNTLPPALPLPAGEGRGEGNSALLAAPPHEENAGVMRPLQIENQKSKIKNPPSPWNIYFRVTLPDAIGFGLVDKINRARGTSITPQQFIADCRARARDEEIFQQSYMCNPMGAAASRIVEAGAIERCRADYEIERVHLEEEAVRQHFGEFNPAGEHNRQLNIQKFLDDRFPILLARPPKIENQKSKIKNCRLGFDVAASGQGNLACIYIDEARGNELWLRGLFTCRTEDWHFLKTVLFHFLKHLRGLQAAGDESGLGRQICWEAAQQFGSKFMKVNFTTKKHDLGFALMNQLSVAEKRFPKAHPDIGADYFALRKTHNGAKWAFSEGRNSLNPASHCDIAWAGALGTHAHTERRCSAGALVVYDHYDGVNASNAEAYAKLTPEERMLWSNDPRIWRPL